VTAREAGGHSPKHIGALTGPTEGRPRSEITFIDTRVKRRTAMRARGRSFLNRLVVLVVAGDDGLKPQDRRGVNHAQAAVGGVGVTDRVVAVNKSDQGGGGPHGAFPAHRYNLVVRSSAATRHCSWDSIRRETAAESGGGGN